MLKKGLIVIVGLLVSTWLYAASSSEQFNAGVNYVNIPRLYANFGEPTRKQFVQVEISLRTETAETATKVTQHLPLLRDRLLRIISQQSEEVLETTEGRELLRAAALKMLNEAISQVEAKDATAPTVNFISDVYFTNFIMQR